MATKVTPSNSFVPAFLKSLRHPDWMPEGITPLPRRFTPRTTPADPDRVPVVLIHGTWLNAYNTWAWLAPRLAAAGYQVFAFNYGHDTSHLSGRHKAVFGSAPLLEAQKEVAAFIDAVLAYTGARQVDLIGHSQGAAQARLYLTDSGGADPRDPSRNKVRRLIGIGPSNHGTTASGSLTLSKFFDPLGIFDGVVRRFLGQAALDQRVGSKAMAHINRFGDTVPGVDYTMICSRFDQVVTPWRTQRLKAGPGARVRNVLVQTGNIKDFSDHLSILYSPRVLDLILEALSPNPEDYRSAHPTVTGGMLPGFGQFPRARFRPR